MKKRFIVYIVLILFILVAIFVGIYVIKNPTINEIDDLIRYGKDNQSVKLIGIVKTGDQIDNEICSEYFYLEDDDGYILQIRINENSFESYLGENVKIIGKYNDGCADTVMCACDPFIDVRSIEIVK